jgi:hypothetical protein
MALYLGMRDLVKYFIKQAYRYQIERTEDYQTRSMRDGRLATLSNSKWEWISPHSEVIGAMRIEKEKVKKRKRNEPSQKEVSSAERMETQRQVIENLNWDYIPITTPVRRNAHDSME